MIPLSLPVEAVSCTSEVVSVDTRTTRESGLSLYLPPNVRVTVVSMNPHYAPIHRSPEFVALAERIAASLPETPDFSEDWMARLVDDFSKFND